MFRTTRYLPEKQMYVHRYGNESYALNVCNLKDPIHNPPCKNFLRDLFIIKFHGLTIIFKITK